LALDLDLLKKHPYATGGIVIVGGIVVFYLISSGASSGGSASTGSSDYSSALAADTQLAQTQAATAVQTNAQQAQLQATELQAQVANTQTVAAQQTSDLNTYAALVASLYGTQQATAQDVLNTQATTTQQANQLLYAQNIQSLQDSVLTDQIDQAANENANNNATNLAATVDQLNSNNYNANLQYQLGQTSLGDATQLAVQQTGDTYALENQAQLWAASGSNPSANQVAVFLSTLPSASSTVPALEVSNAQQAAAASIASASEVNSIAKAGSSVLTGLFG
jgi:hypothetical protein